MLSSDTKLFSSPSTVMRSSSSPPSLVNKSDFKSKQTPSKTSSPKSIFNTGKSMSTEPQLTTSMVTTTAQEKSSGFGVDATISKVKQEQAEILGQAMAKKNSVKIKVAIPKQQQEIGPSTMWTVNLNDYLDPSIDDPDWFYKITDIDGTSSGSRDYCALSNNDFTCYAISCLQVLYTTPKIRAYLIEHQHSGPFHGALGRLFASMESLSMNTPPDEDYPVTNADQLLEQFRFVKPNFVAGLQHDAQEFLVTLTELLHQEVNCAKRPTGTPGEPRSAEEAWDYHVTYVDDSFLSQFLMGQVESSLTCLACVHQSRSWTSIWQLQLQIAELQEDKKSTNAHLTLLNCIEDFVAEEILQDDSAPFCASCGERQIACKRQTICRSPRGLVVHLKRFNARGGKINRPVEIDTQLILCGRRLKLHSGVIHRGGTEATEGHYQALVRVGTDDWALFDDEYIDEDLADRKALRLLRKYAYLVFYYDEAEEDSDDMEEAIELAVTGQE